MQKPEQVSKEEWVAWRNSRPTQQLIYTLLSKREAISEWVLGGGAEDNAAYLHREIGQCMSLLDTLEYITKTFDYLEKEPRENESLGTSSPQDYS